MRRISPSTALKLLVSVLGVLLLFQAGREVYAIAWIEGVGFSLKRGVFFFAYLLFAGFTAAGGGLALWRGELLRPRVAFLLGWRERLAAVRWAIVLILLLLPIVFFQYTPWGVLFARVGIRLLVWGFELLALTFLLTRGGRYISLPALATAAVISGSCFALAVNLRRVTDYPFPLGWSEGNRMFDYSMLFGQGRYIIPEGQRVFVHLSLGRQLVGGLPFLYHGLTIAQMRAWMGLIYVLPYLLLGFATFWKARRRPGSLVWLGGLWGALFLLQGPIHPPLILAAALTVLAWGSPLFWGVPLLIVSGYFAEVSRFTWAFAPAMWIGMLEWVGGEWQGERLTRRSWLRVIALVLAGLFGGVVLTHLLPAPEGAGGGGGFTLRFTDQPLLWYRLLPNATYRPGILLGLLMAVGPLVALLVLWVMRGEWALHRWQKLGLLLPLLAFLVVGLIVSTKIGGGGDLHNLDMFFIGLLFTAALAWKALSLEAFFTSPVRWAHLLLLVILLGPAYPHLMGLRPLQFSRHIPWLVALTDSQVPGAKEANYRRLFGSLPPDEEVEQALETVREVVATASRKGEVLFMDQRQLLTFGYIQGVPLIVDYEKKYTMDKAMAGNVAYFQRFYSDLAAKRFALIVSDPLREPIKDADYAFGEENNAWVKWVARPLLCYYKPLVTYSEMRLQLLVPRTDISQCARALPPEVRK